MFLSFVCHGLFYLMLTVAKEKKSSLKSAPRDGDREMFYCADAGCVYLLNRHNFHEILDK
jgi:hypothetical protein